MADPGWGVASGYISGTLDQQAIQLNKYALAEAPVKLATEQVNLEQQKMALQVAKTSAEAHQKMAQMLAGQPNSSSSVPNDAAQTLFKMGSTALQYGLVEEGVKDIKDASEIQTHQADAAAKIFETTQKQAAYASSILAYARSQTTPEAKQAAWKQGNAIIEAQTGKPSIYKNVPYSDTLADQLEASIQTRVQKAEEERDKAQAREQDSLARQHALEVPLIQARTEAERLRVDNLRKVGADATSKPADVKAITDRIQSDYGKGVSKQTADVIAGPIAEDMRARIKQGTAPSAAAAQAYDAAKRRGDLSTLSKPTAPVEAASGLIDDLISQVEASKKDTLGVTGFGGTVRRWEETAGNITGLSKGTAAHDFEAQLTTLQLQLPKALLSSGQFTKMKMNEISKIARGLKPGDTPENTISALQQLKAALQGESPSSSQGAVSLEDYLKAQGH